MRVGGVLGFIAIAAIAASDDSALRTAEALKRTGKLDQAEATLRRAAEQRPDWAEVHRELGRLLLDRANYEAAVMELGRAVQLNSESLDYNMALAEALIGWRRFPTAVEFLQAIRPRFQDKAAFHYNLGLAFYGLHNTREALPELESAARLNPDLDRAKFLIAGCRVAMGELSTAAEIYRDLVKQNPQNHAYWLALGQVLDSLGEDYRSEALSACQMALRRKPSSLAAQFQTAAILSKTGRYAAARPLLERLVRERPNELPAHVVLARVYSHLNLPELAKRESAIAASLSSGRADTRDRIDEGAVYSMQE
jgi:protein O-GlcNAc transferase